MAVIDEGIKNKEKFSNISEFTKEDAKKEMEYVVKKVKEMLPRFTEVFPGDSSVGLTYPPIDNYQGSWTTGFWTGILWMCYEYTGDELFKNAAKIQCESFRDIVDKKRGMETHDLGFLFAPSCVLGYKLTGDERMKETAVLAADFLIARYHEKGEFIQAWGELGTKENYRLIIDCMNNIPLLFWASEVTGNSKYKDIATKHAHTSSTTVVREDATTHHTFYFDIKTGAPLKGETHQGYSDDSTWARGQAWGVSGFPISYRYTGNEKFLDLSIKLANVFLNRLPKDYIPFWDLIFTDGSGEERDSSSAAIVACGLLEILKTYDGEYKEYYKNALFAIMSSLSYNYTTKNSKADGLLLHGMYNKPRGIGIDECTLWGDFYFVEALMNIIKPDRALCW